MSGAGRGRSRLGLRALAVVGATLAALAVWLVAVPVAGVDLAAGFGDGPPDEIGARGVVVTALGAGLAGWALLEVLERVVRRPRTVWVAVALIVLLVSLIGPLAGAVSTAATVTLVVLHLAVAAVLVPILARTV